MHDLSQAAGAGALRLLALSSALFLAACGGGGGGDPVTEAPVEQLPPVVAEKRVSITAANQTQVAVHAGMAMAAMGPMAVLFAQGLIPNSFVQRAAMPAVRAPLATPAEVLAASVRKFRPANAGARLAVGVTTTETHVVACTTGSGTVTITQGEEAGGYSYTADANLQNCQTDLQGGALVDGRLKLAVIERRLDESFSAVADIVAAKYSVKSAGSEVGMDGDMHLEMGPTGYVTSGERFSFTSLAGPVFEEQEAQEAPATRTVTMIAFRQEIVSRDDGFTVTTQGKVETGEFGETAIYALATSEPLRMSSEAGYFVAGSYRILGAGDTTLVITAVGDGTFRMERDDQGNGSIDATATGLTAAELSLSLGFFLP